MAGGKGSVLVVEADVQMADRIRMIAELKVGASVRVVGDIFAAWPTVKATHPDVIVVGLQGKGADAAATFVHLLKSRPETREIPVVALTAGENAREDLVGCDATLATPLQAPRVAETLRAYIPLPWVTKVH